MLPSQLILVSKYLLYFFKTLAGCKTDKRNFVIQHFIIYNYFGMISKRLLLLIFLVLGSFNLVIGQSQTEARTQLEISEQKMDSVFTTVIEKYEEDPGFIASLKKAQEAWISFRDAHLESMYPGKDKRVEYGSIYPMCASNILVKLNNQRSEQLKTWVEGTEEGEVCAGSIKLARELEQ